VEDDRATSAHGVATQKLIDTAQNSLARLQEVNFGALALLLLLGGWAIALVYREMIAPLQRKLVESRARIERQEKLASLGGLQRDRGQERGSGS